MITDNITFTIGMKIVVPEPQDDDTWDGAMISEIDDITDNNTIIFSDNDWCEHEIELTRVKLYQPETK